MKNKSRFKLLGFTLIELLFVIAIISVLASLGLSMVKQRSQQAKVEKTALQMQQLMQAGLAYYVDNHCWPSGPGPSTNTGCIANPARFDSYIPINGMLNPWGQTYNYGLAPGKTNVFEVAVATPDPNVAGNTPIAQRIAGMLPNAGFGIDTSTVTAQLCPVNNCVYAQATLPAQSANPSSVYIAAIGTVTKSNPTTASFKCQSGYNPSIQAYLSNYEYNELYDWQSHSYTSSVLANFSFNTVQKTNLDGTNVYNVSISDSSVAQRCSALTYTSVFVFRIQFFCRDGGKDDMGHHFTKGVDIFDNYTINYTIYCSKN